ncbi:enoyl-CoA hydratase/isomerase [Actinokineospora sp. PR83]|uniref:enoyl-CoA hydratase/isomerase n=1 Tax=Actinokineospora sp. PR83 TaxID=2884908 RepID=UPI0027DEBABD|nr:enoyl-CoA hydratase/isomerase [Actinokineospora sp. PR83]MCG8915256.1 enoyl-CoA hydratase/isomerase [Actinokineospora sp. PR83]
MDVTDYQTVRVTVDGRVWRMRLDRPEARNAIDDRLLDECLEVLDQCAESAAVVVLEGGAEYFCFGADFERAGAAAVTEQDVRGRADKLYELFLRLANGPYVSVAHVRGVANAGGVGLVAACDVVIADDTARFSLSELLFGLYPACVLPFLARRCGTHNANYLALTTTPVDARDAMRLHLVDAIGPDSTAVVDKHLVRLRRLPKDGVVRYKRYAQRLDDALERARAIAVDGNAEVFTDPVNLERIRRYVERGVPPWER